MTFARTSRIHYEQRTTSEAPVGTHGDVYDRYLVRMEERPIARASSRRRWIGCPWPSELSDHRVILLPKSRAWMSDMKSMIHHFNTGHGGHAAARGRGVRAGLEPKGEKGYSSPCPMARRSLVRWRIRPPSHVNLSAISKTVNGHLLSDVHRHQREHSHCHGGDLRALNEQSATVSRGNVGEIPYQPVFVAALRQELDALLGRYPNKMAALLPALWIMQAERGWVSEEDRPKRPSCSQLTPAYVKGVVTFYTMTTCPPVASTSSRSASPRRARRAAPTRSWEGAPQGTPARLISAPPRPTGRFTVIEVECLGACGFVTPIMVNEEVHRVGQPENLQLLTRFQIDGISPAVAFRSKRRSSRSVSASRRRARSRDGRSAAATARCSRHST